MSAVYYCDLCGTKMERPQKIELPNLNVNNWAHETGRADVCDGCWDELFEFVNGLATRKYAKKKS